MTDRYHPYTHADTPGITLRDQIALTVLTGLIAESSASGALLDRKISEAFDVAERFLDYIKEHPNE